MGSEMQVNRTHMSPRRNLRKTLGAFFYIIFLLSVCVGIIGLAVLLFDVFTNCLLYTSDAADE